MRTRIRSQQIRKGKCRICVHEVTKTLNAGKSTGRHSRTIAYQQEMMTLIVVSPDSPSRFDNSLYQKGHIVCCVLTLAHFQNIDLTNFGGA